MYACLTGGYPFNSFLAGFTAAVGQFVLTGLNPLTEIVPCYLEFWIFLAFFEFFELFFYSPLLVSLVRISGVASFPVGLFGRLQDYAAFLFMNV